jgi:hypothetical protein
LRQEKEDPAQRLSEEQRRALAAIPAGPFRLPTLIQLGTGPRIRQQAALQFSFLKTF